MTPKGVTEIGATVLLWASFNLHAILSPAVRQGAGVRWLFSRFLRMLKMDARRRSRIETSTLFHTLPLVNFGGFPG